VAGIFGTGRDCPVGGVADACIAQARDREPASRLNLGPQWRGYFFLPPELEFPELLPPVVLPVELLPPVVVLELP